MYRVLVRDAVPLFLEMTASSVAPSTLKLYRCYLEKFVTFAGDKALKEVTPAMLLKFSTKYHPVSIVQRLFSWARIEAHLIKRNPLQGMRKAFRGHRRRILSASELARLLRACRPSFRSFALAMVQSIARPREIREVRWGDIRTSGSPAWSVSDLLAGRAFFWFGKFKAQAMRKDRYAVRVIPICPRLGRLLARLWGDGKGAVDVVFRNEEGKPWTSNAVRCQFRRLRVRAGIGVDVAGENVVAYSLRHTSATEAVGAGIKGFTLAELMGHSDIRMTQRYVHLRPDHLLDAANAISRWKKAHAERKRPPRTA